MYSYNTDNWVLEAVGRLLLAGVLGALVGAEREHHGRSAGFRTHLLTSLGAAVAITVSLHLVRVFSGPDYPQWVSLDPGRVAHGVMVGIGFLGAGAIIRYGRGVRGLTTGASLWCTASVGLACGLGMYVIAAVATAFVLFTLIVLSKLDHYIPSRCYRTVTLRLPPGDVPPVDRIRDLLRMQRVFVVDAEYTRNFEEGADSVVLHVTMSSRISPDVVLAIADDLPDLASISVQ